MPPPRVLFVVEGNTDIRFVTGLAEICRLTMVVPAEPFRQSGLDGRLKNSRASVSVDQIEGGRVLYQLRSLRHVFRRAREFDVILSQEMLRGSLNSCITGWLRGIPVATYMCMPPVEYFRCRRERKQCGWLRAIIGETAIRGLLNINGRLATRCIALGPYLMGVAKKYSKRTVNGSYYGVDTSYYRPVDENERSRLRVKLGLPPDRFVVLLSSRISHEKDPETVLQAVSIARAGGLDAVLLNLGGGFEDFLRLAQSMQLPEVEKWVLGRPAANPMTELAAYYQAADCLAMASLAEGLGLAPLEALACGLPTVCTAVGGMEANLTGYARLTPRRDPNAMAKELRWVSANHGAARRQALAGRDFVVENWSRETAFEELAEVLADCCKPHRVPAEVCL